MSFDARLQDKIDRIKEELADANLSYDRREMLFDVLRAASLAATAADEDKVQAMSEALLLLTIVTLEDKLHSDATKAAILAERARQHDEICPFRKGGADPSPKIALAYMFRWPLTWVACVGMVCGLGPYIIEAFAKAFS
jgi:hypothetical protein